MVWARFAGGVAAVAILVAVASCGDDDSSGFGPVGAIGAACVRDLDCPSGHCCDSNNCGGGMCTYRCNRDIDCPASTACQHGSCFYICRVDADCAAGQKCEHDGVCEWD